MFLEALCPRRWHHPFFLASKTVYTYMHSPQVPLTSLPLPPLPSTPGRSHQDIAARSLRRRDHPLLDARSIVSADAESIRKREGGDCVKNCPDDGAISVAFCFPLVQMKEIIKSRFFHFVTLCSRRLRSGNRIERRALSCTWQ